MLWILVLMLLGFWLMSRFARKQQQKMADEQAARIEEAMVPGTWVRTRAGFYGKVVEVNGEVVTLATMLGDESLWAKSSIYGAEEPPFELEDDAEHESISDVSDANQYSDITSDSSRDESERD